MITQFLNYQRTIKSASTYTLQAYEKDLRQFVAWYRDYTDAPRWSAVSRSDLQAYVEYLCEQGLVPTSVGRKVSALRSFFNYLMTIDALHENPCRYVQSPKRGKPLPKTVQLDEVAATLADPVVDLRTKLMIALLVETGVRISELLAMSTADFDKSQRSIRIVGKGAKQRVVYYGDRSRALLNAVIGYRQGKLFECSAREARYAIHNALSRHSEAPQLSPHVLRHTFATSMLNDGAPLSAISKLLGHESVKTTEMYAHLADTAARDAAEAHRPQLPNVAPDLTQRSFHRSVASFLPRLIGLIGLIVASLFS